jgi:hypothetical protein
MPAKNKVEFIMVHCLATDPDFMINQPVDAVVAEVREWHVKQRGWKDIAYAMVIHRDGSRGKGRDLDKDGDVWEEVGAGAKGWNHNCIHIALNGGKTSDANDEFSENYTDAQDAALRQTIAEIRAWAGWEVPLKGHNEVAAKACPGFQVNRWFNHQAPRKLSSSTTMQASMGGALAAASGGVTALGALEGPAQIIVTGALVLVLLAFLWIARERIQKWAKGVH